MQCSAWRLNLERIDCGVVIWRGRASGSGQTLSAPQLLTLLTFCLQRQYSHVHRWVSIMSVALQRYKQNQPVSTHYIHQSFHTSRLFPNKYVHWAFSLTTVQLLSSVIKRTPHICECGPHYLNCVPCCTLCLLVELVQVCNTNADTHPTTKILKIQSAITLLSIITQKLHT